MTKKVFEKKSFYQRLEKRPYEDWPVFAAVALYWIVTLVLLGQALEKTQGHLTYAFEDGYTHMSVAKNFAQYGVWGVTKYEFSSSTSSLVWPLMLVATYSIFGVNEVAPLLFNLLFSILIILFSYKILKERGMPPLANFFVLAILVFITPLYMMTLLGMEYNLQLLTVMAFSFLAAVTLSDKTESGKKMPKNGWLLLALAALVTATRYEGVFLIVTASAFFYLRKNLVFPTLLIIAGFLPLALYGWISVSNGWQIAPNSVIFKASFTKFPPLESFFQIPSGAIDKIKNTPYIMGIVFTALAVFCLAFDKRKGVWTLPQTLLLIFVVTVALQLYFARVGWFYRYEAYILGWGVVAVGLAFAKFDRSLLPKYVAILVILLLLGIVPMNSFSSLTERVTSSIQKTPQAMKNVFDQHYQMGLFVKEFYKGETIATNDIGVVTFLGESKLVDFAALGDNDIAKASLRDQYAKEMPEIARWKKTKIAMVAEDRWIIQNLPKEWVQIGAWRISDWTVDRANTIFFFAPPEEEERAIQNLKAFSPRLPASVLETGKYVLAK